MTLKLVGNDGPDTPRTEDDIKYFTQDVRYHNKVSGVAETVRVEGYPLFMNGLLSFVRMDDKKNTYSVLSVPLNEVIDVKVVLDEDEEA